MKPKLFLTPFTVFVEGVESVTTFALNWAKARHLNYSVIETGIVIKFPTPELALTGHAQLMELVKTGF